jgi:lipopolysaccharide transport system ATP-binding protein
LRLCNRALLIEQGRLVQDGPVPEVAATYLRLGGGSQGERLYQDDPYMPGDAVAKLRRVRVRSRGGQTKATMDIAEEVGIEMEFVIESDGAILFPFISIFNEWATEVLWATDSDTEWHGRPRPAGRYQVVAWLPSNFLTAGTMSVTAALCSLRPRVDHFREADVVVFQALDHLGPGGARGDFTDHIGSVTRPKLQWTVDCDCRSTTLV